MANTYTRLYVQAIFTPKFREHIIKPTWEDELFKYITGIVQNFGHKMLAINGMPDHIHVFFRMKPNQSVSELISKIKSNSSRWINEKRFIHGKFSWQEGFGAFSYGHSQLDDVIGYVMNQKEQHKKSSFREEYLSFLKKFDVDYDQQYLFEFFD